MARTSLKASPFGAHCFLNRVPHSRVGTVVFLGILSQRNVFREAPNVHTKKQNCQPVFHVDTFKRFQIVVSHRIW